MLQAERALLQSSADNIEKPPETVPLRLLTVYLTAACCFFVICLTNDTILSILSRFHLLYRSNPAMPVDFARTTLFFLSPTKELLFFICSTILLLPLFLAVKRWFATHLIPSDYLQTLASLICCGLLISTFVPVSFGRSYARVSIDPFNESNSQINRRLLLPALAHIWHLNGYLFTVFFWGTVVLAAILLKVYLKTRDATPTLLQEIALLSTGIIASSFETPGYPDATVFALSLIALLASAEGEKTSTIPLAAFALALMAHESAAIIIFGPLYLFILRRRSWLPAVVLTAIYVVAVMSNFHFHLTEAWKIQSHVSEVPAQTYLRQHPLLVLAAALFSFKAFWLLVAIGVFYMWRTQKRQVLYVLLSFFIVFAATYIAVDYSRLISFATLSMVLCFISVKKHLPSLALNCILLCSLLIPSLYVGGNSGIVSEPGLYRLIYRHLSLPL